MKIKKFHLDNANIHYLKHMCFEIVKKYYFEFDSISNDCNYVHLFIGY